MRINMIENGFELVRLMKQESGLPYNIKMYSSGCGKRYSNTPILLLENHSKDIQLPISTDPIDQEIQYKKEIESWIRNNYDILTKHWVGDLSDRKMLCAVLNQI